MATVKRETRLERLTLETLADGKVLRQANLRLVEASGELEEFLRGGGTAEKWVVDVKVTLIVDKKGRFGVFADIGRKYPGDGMPQNLITFDEGLAMVETCGPGPVQMEFRVSDIGSPPSDRGDDKEGWSDDDVD